MKNSPTEPPSKHKNTDSNRNWKRMKKFFAPRDFWIPIKLVLYFTETNIIFAMLNPPTRMEKIPITNPEMLITPKIWSKP